MRCPTHQRRAVQSYDHRRGSPTARGYGWQWRQYAKSFLRLNPLCHYCAYLGRTTAAECVDHATPHKGDERLLWQPDNHRAACIPCNSAKGDRDEQSYIATLSRKQSQ